MNKILNILLVILIFVAIVVGIMLVVKYGGNYINDQEIKETVAKIEEELEELEDNNNGEKIEGFYKGYSIEGILEIPKIEIKYPIINETTEETMKLSITKFWGPENPNEIGNYTIAGHNNRDGTMFGKTKYLQKGDIIKLTNLNNTIVEYRIFDIYSVDPNDTSYVESIENGTREVTLITCTKGHEERLIIKAREEKNI